MNNDLELIEELYDLMKIAVAVTKRGEIEEDYTKTISLDIGDGILFYDPYYNKLSYEYNNNPFIDALADEKEKEAKSKLTCNLCPCKECEYNHMIFAFF